MSAGAVGNCGSPPGLNVVNVGKVSVDARLGNVGLAGNVGNDGNLLPAPVVV